METAYKLLEGFVVMLAIVFCLGWILACLKEWMGD